MSHLVELDNLMMSLSSVAALFFSFHLSHLDMVRAESPPSSAQNPPGEACRSRGMAPLEEGVLLLREHRGIMAKGIVPNVMAALPQRNGAPAASTSPLYIPFPSQGPFPPQRAVQGDSKQSPNASPFSALSPPAPPEGGRASGRIMSVPDIACRSRRRGPLEEGALPHSPGSPHAAPLIQSQPVGQPSRRRGSLIQSSRLVEYQGDFKPCILHPKPLTPNPHH